MPRTLTLTYMSIYDELRARVNEGRLVLLPPPDIPGSMLMRQLYISNSIQSLLDGPWKNDEWEERCGLLQSDLDHFVTGDMIAGRMPPSKSIKAYLAQLDSTTDNVWEIRSVHPNPQLRLFGHFAGKDCFVALICKKRPCLDTEVKWRDAVEECKTAWRNLFPSYDVPILGGTIHDYVSKKIYPV